MLDQSIQLYGGPGDGGTFFPVGGIPTLIFWPCIDREAEYRLIFDVDDGFHYAHHPGEPRGKESPQHAVSRSGG